MEVDEQEKEKMKKLQQQYIFTSHDSIPLVFFFSSIFFPSLSLFFFFSSELHLRAEKEQTNKKKWEERERQA